MSSAAKADTSKKSRREIANHNERRRMQSINTGFEQLRDVLPAYREAPSDRLSKVRMGLLDFFRAFSVCQLSLLFSVVSKRFNPCSL